MPIEIEKKFRLTQKQRETILSRLPEIGATLIATEFEENTIYGSDQIDLKSSIIRLRRVGNKAILTYKERLKSTSTIKHQQEDETQVSDADAVDAILQALGLIPILVYEKRRIKWKLGQAEVVVDDLPFGLFMEIEASEADIMGIERQLAIKGLKVETETYPRLTRKHGRKKGPLVEARFEKKGTRNRSTKNFASE